MARLLAVVFLVCAVAFAADQDGDGVPDDKDNCPAAPNELQLDSDGDGVGNACDVCLHVSDPDQDDTDGDGVGDACDGCPDTDADVPDYGGETFHVAVDAAGCSASQLCPCDGPKGGVVSWTSRARYVACLHRQTTRLRRLGRITPVERWHILHIAATDGCARARDLPGDRDGDGIPDDGDESGRPGDSPCRGGATTNCDDNCPRIRNPLQSDTDGDGIGDACDPDIDGDGIPNAADDCPKNADPKQEDADDDGVGDACDLCPDTPEAEDVDAHGCASEQTPATGS